MIEAEELQSIDGDEWDAEDESPVAEDSRMVVAAPKMGEDELVDQLYRDLARGEHAKAVAAEAQMRRVIEANQAIEHKFVEGLGQVVARIPAEVFYHWVARFGSDAWNDGDVLKFLAKRNPGLLVKTPSRAFRVGVDIPKAPGVLCAQ